MSKIPFVSDKLEDNDAFLFDDANEDDNLDEFLLSVMADDSELVDIAADINKMNTHVDAVSATVERLEGIRDAIAKYGISRPMMLAADPQGELVEKGICGAYENLDIQVTMDYNAEMAIENLNAALEGIGDKLKSLFKAIGRKFKAFGIGWMKLFRNHEAAMKRALALLSNATPDEDKFNSADIKSYSKDEFYSAVACVNRVCDVFNEKDLNDITTAVVAATTKLTMDPADIATVLTMTNAIMRPLIGDTDLRAYCGITITDKGKSAIQSVHISSPLVKDRWGSLVELGWQLSDVVPALEAAIQMEERASKTAELYESLSNMCERLSSSTTVVVKDGEGNTTESHTEHEYDIFTRSLYDLLGEMLEINAYLRVSNIFSSIEQVANAAIKAK